MKPLRTSLNCDLREVSGVRVLIPNREVLSPLHAFALPVDWLFSLQTAFSYFCQGALSASRVLGAVVFVNRFWAEPIKWLGKKITVMHLPSVLRIISIKHWGSSSQIRTGERVITEVKAEKLKTLKNSFGLWPRAFLWFREEPCISCETWVFGRWAVCDYIWVRGLHGIFILLQLLRIQGIRSTLIKRFKRSCSPDIFKW